MDLAMVSTDRCKNEKRSGIFQSLLWIKKGNYISFGCVTLNQLPQPSNITASIP